jgi:hypothetical protein
MLETKRKEPRAPDRQAPEARRARLRWRASRNSTPARPAAPEAARRLKATVQQASAKSHIAGKLAGAVLGISTPVVRLLAGAVQSPGVYSKHGVPQVATRIGVMEASGKPMSLHRHAQHRQVGPRDAQAALQVTGNNIANAGNADYTRQSATSRRPKTRCSPRRVRRHGRRPHGHPAATSTRH